MSVPPGSLPVGRLFAGSSSSDRPLLSLVIPTYNERENLERLLWEFTVACQREGIPTEIVLVDDNSPDGTGDLAEELRSQFPALRVLHRPGKQGLGSAVLAGFALATGDLLAVMDADLSHPPEVVPRLALMLHATDADVAVASRYTPGGGVAGWPWQRRWASRAATWLTRPLTPVRDPLSGCFALHRHVVDGVSLGHAGFKILLEILVKGRVKNVEEVPYTFRDRRAGKSKMGPQEIARYLLHLGRLYAWRLREWRSFA